MAKLIVKAKYYNGKTHTMGGYLKYIATREGVEKIDESRKYLPATRKQTDLIGRILQDFPDAKEMLEYEDYIRAPTVGNASEFITRVLEDNAPEVMDGKTYADYIATRPGAERFGKHGLFGNDGEAIDLEAVSKELNAYTGNVHTLIISLRRGDAARLGFDAGVRWRDMLRTQTETLAKNYKIPMENLRWYGAFHNEGKHPHVHVMVWSEQSGQAYLTSKGLQKIKASLVHDIFHQDLTCVYERQTEYRNAPRQEAREQAADIAQRIASGSYENPELAERLQALARILKESTGRQVYKFLKPEVKLLVDSIVNTLAEDERISSLFDLWYEQKEEVLQLYHTKLPARISLADCPEFLPIKNAVIREAVALGTVTPEAGASRIPSGDTPGTEDNFNGLTDADMESYLDSFTDEDAPPEVSAQEEAAMDSNHRGSPDWLPAQTSDDTDTQDMDGYFDSLVSEDAPPLDAEASIVDVEDASEQDKPNAGVKSRQWWSDTYKEARRLLYGTKDTPPDFPTAFEQMCAEASSGNGFAMYDLGKMYLSGVGCNENADVAQEWFQKTYHAFIREEKAVKKPDYLQYRIGKLFSFGYGVDQDYAQAAVWYEKAAAAGNPFAAYSLAGLYRRGEGVAQDDAKAFSLYKIAAEDEKKPNAYAMYELGKLCRDGIGTTVDVEASAQWFQKAYQGFQEIEQSMPDEKLYYRLGEMNRTGTGTEVNLPQAFAYYTKAAALGNTDAFYRLGKLCVLGQGVEQDFTQAATWFEKAVAAGNPFAAYSLAGLYRWGEGVTQDDDKAFSLYEMAAEDEKNPNAYAMYELGKLCRDGIGTAVDVEASAQWFQKAYQGFQEIEQSMPDEKLYYRLGEMNRTGAGTEVNLPQAFAYYTKAAALGNTDAFYRLGKLYVLGQGVEQDFTQAAIWFEKAVAVGNPFAAYSLARLYRRGEGVTQDDAKAFSLYEMAAEDEENPNAYAMYELGKMYATGTGTEINKAASVLWFQKAAAGLESEAARGDSYAQYRLGTLYLFYLKDQEKAMAWLQASANSGNFYAQQLLQDIHGRIQMTAGNCVLRLFHFAGRILQNRITENPRRNVDRKLRRKIAEKKLAQGLHLE